MSDFGGFVGDMTKQRLLGIIKAEVETYPNLRHPELIENVAKFIRNSDFDNYEVLHDLEEIYPQKFIKELKREPGFRSNQSENKQRNSSSLGSNVDKKTLDKVAENIAFVSDLLLDIDNLDYYKINISKRKINAKLKQGIQEIEDSKNLETLKKDIKQGFKEYENPEVDYNKEEWGYLEDESPEDFLITVTGTAYAGILSALPKDFQNFEGRVELYNTEDRQGLIIRFSKDVEEYKNEYTAEELYYFFKQSEKIISRSKFSQGEKVSYQEVFFEEGVYIDFKELCEGRLDSISEDKTSDWDEVKDMDGIEFEHFLKDLFDSMGYKVEVTDASNDQGADLLLERKTEKIVVQAKRYKGSVSNSAVQETSGAIGHYNADRGIVVTTGDFTDSAKELADSNNVSLWNSSKLKSKMEKYLDQ